MKKLFFTIIVLMFWATTNAQNNKPVAVNDTIYTYFGDTVYINPLANDYDPDGDTIRMWQSFHGFEKINDTLWRKVVSIDELESGNYLEKLYDDTLFYTYRIADGTLPPVTAKVILIPTRYINYAYSDANNVNALISPVGNHFWDFNDSKFEVPKGSGKNAVFCSTFWMGGLTPDSNLCLAAEKYRQVGMDFTHGPIRLHEDSAETAKWLPGTWKLNKEDIDFHKNNWDKNGYIPNEVILNWPANGNPANGQMEIYAPFYDRNYNGKYESMKGDYPLIRGDQTVFFIMNDSMLIHTETKWNKMGIEVLGMAYEFSRPDNPVLNNTLFMHYDIINRSANNYENAYLGLFLSNSLGDANDDYIGTDVAHGMVYAYNSDDMDGSGEPWTYGNKPPAFGMKIIGGPYLPADGIDNPTGECSYDINGLNFGDEVVDNERMGMTNSFQFYNYSGGTYWETEFAPDYYYQMKGLWKDGSSLIFGGNGHESTGGVGPECNFVFPDKSDTNCNWGTGGVLPNGGYNQNGYFWNEITTGNVPGNRPILASIGPFNVRSGESIPLDFCYIFVQAEGGAIASRDSLIKAAGYIQNNEREIIAFNAPPYGKKENSAQSNFKVFPNPAKDRIVVFSENKDPQEYRIYNLTGSLVQTGMLVQGNNQLNISSLTPGFYIIESGQISTKLIVQ